MDSGVEQLHTRADSLVTQFEQEGRTNYIEEAISLDRQALNLRPSGHPDRSNSLNTVAAHLHTRYKHLGVLADLDEAIVCDRESLELRPRDHPDRSASLNNLAAHLSTRYNQTGASTDLNEAVAFNREALDLCPRGHPDRSTYLNNLAVHLSTRYRHLGTMTDLEEGIVLSREALELRQPGSRNRAMVLSNIAVDLTARYKQLGELTDLDEAVALAREALDLCPLGHPSRSRALNNLAGPLSARYKRLGDIADLEEVIVLGQEALELRPRGHPDRSISLSNLAGFLSTRYTQNQLMADLDAAITLDREALDLRPKGHPDRSTSLNTLADLLSMRYKQLWETGDINEAIGLSREGLTLCPRGHPQWSTALNNLAYRLRIRYKQLREANDLEELFTLYGQLEDFPQIVFSEDLSAATTWVDAAEDFQHPTLLPAYKTSLPLLLQHLAALPLPPSLDDLKKLTLSLAVNALTACLHNHLPTSAVELLELGQGVFWNQLIHLRSPLDDVVIFPLAGKTLADKFTRLVSRIRDALTSPDPDQHQRAQDLDIQLRAVVSDIRQLPGLSRFLQSPVFLDLQLAATEGPVIIVNAGTRSCDALIVFEDQDPVHVPLQILRGRVRELSAKFHNLSKGAENVDVTKDLEVILREIWDQVVSPIIDSLRTAYPPECESRIWWYPTADFSLLPLHAAGSYTEGQQNLDDLYISSYTPTLNALIRARRRNNSSSATERRHMISIGHSNPTGESELVSVGSELSNIARRFEDLTTFTRLEGPESYISQVTEELKKNQWVHLACHCILNPKQPIESAFTLHDGPLTLRQITESKSENPEFGYLSPRNTTLGDDLILEELDGLVHPAFALQSAGFRSVVGSMWAADDGHACRIASTFYEHMVDEQGPLDYTRAALALHRTMKSLEDIPFYQRIHYIHVGV